MNHPLAIRLAAILLVATVAGCGGPATTPTPTPAPTALLPTLEPTPTATTISLPAPTGRILYSAIAPTATSGSVYVMNADGSGVTKLTGTRPADAPAWSPDGTRVAFQGGDGFWVMNADGSNATRIYHELRMQAFGPAWSPDGQQIAFISAPPCGPCSPGMTWTLYIMNADGSGLRKVTDTQTGSTPAWSPDGQTIVFVGTASDPPTAANGLQSIRLDGSGLRQLTSGDDFSPAWSPDGRFAFLRGATTATSGAILFTLVVANGDGSAPLEIHLPIAVGPPLAWSPDGAWIALSGAANMTLLETGQSDIWIMRPDGTNAMNLTNTTGLGEGSPSWH
jgi:Tol biopolymer transport system component